MRKEKAEIFAMMKEEKKLKRKSQKSRASGKGA